MNILLQLYPTGVVEDIRYSIKVSNDSIYVENHSPRNINDIVYYTRKLTVKESNHLNKIISKIKKKTINRQPSVLDTWGATLKINGVIYYEEDDFSFKNCEQPIKELLDYLTSLSSLKIDLYGFS